MVAINTLPSILDAHGKYAIQIEDAPSTFVVNFTIFQNNETTTTSAYYASFNGSSVIYLSSILKSIFRKFEDKFQYEQDEIQTHETSGNFALLSININNELTFDFKVVNAALQYGDGTTMLDFMGKRLGVSQEMPIFSGYPMSTSVLSKNGIQRIINTRGCAYLDYISEDVNIEVVKPDGTTVTAVNDYHLFIPDDETSNGVYTVNYTTSDETLTRTFIVINAGDPTAGMNVDLIWTRETEDVGNSYSFQNVSFFDNLIMSADFTAAPTAPAMVKFKITDPSGNVFETDYSPDLTLQWNPYITADDIYKPMEVGDYTVTVTAIVDGFQLEKTETFTVNAIEHDEDYPLGNIITILRTPYYSFMPDTFAITPVDAMITSVFGADTVSKLWEIRKPDLSIITIVDQVIVLKQDAVATNDVEIDQNGEWVFKATYNLDGQNYTSIREVNITIES